MKLKETFYCPTCGDGNEVEFEYWRPDNGDQFNKVITCKCGLQLDCMIEAEVRIEMIAYHPEILP